MREVGSGAMGEYRGGQGSMESDGEGQGSEGRAGVKGEDNE